jgi:hypothetical protein
MPSKMRTAKRESGKARCNRTDESALRRAFFAQAGELAVRYGVCFDDVMTHVYAARANHPHCALPVIRHIDDLVHAVACVADVHVAWWDLTEQYERALVRACRQWLDATEAIVFVRRLFSALRRDDKDVQSLRGFDGTRTLRRWLGDRIVGRMNTEGPGFAISAASLEPTASGTALCENGPRLRRHLLDGYILEGDVIWRPTRPTPPPFGAPVRDRSSGASG